MDLELTDRVVFVTGSSGGVGRETALAFAREGARVVVNYRSNREGAEAAVEEIEAGGGEAIALQCDVADRDSVDALVSEAVERWGAIDVLVNNAVAYEGEQPFGEMTHAQWMKQLDVTLTGAFNCAQACLPHMRRRGWGRIVNVSARGAITGQEKLANYSAAKAGVLGLTRALAKELGPDGILVNAIAPILVMTEEMKGAMPESVQERLAKRNPMRRLAVPGDIARTIVFLGSGWNTFVNGEVITVGGGRQR